MRPSEVRELGVVERRARLEDLIEEYRSMRFGHVMQQLSDPLQLRKIRRDIARLKTIIAEDEARAPAAAAVPTGTEGDES